MLCVVTSVAGGPCTQDVGSGADAQTWQMITEGGSVWTGYPAWVEQRGADRSSFLLGNLQRELDQGKYRSVLRSISAARCIALML